MVDQVYGIRGVLKEVSVTLQALPQSFFRLLSLAYITLQILRHLVKRGCEVSELDMGPNLDLLVQISAGDLFCSVAQSDKRCRKSAGKKENQPSSPSSPASQSLTQQDP